MPSFEPQCSAPRPRSLTPQLNLITAVSGPVAHLCRRILAKGPDAGATIRAFPSPEPRSAQRHPFDGARRSRVGQAHHPQRVEQAEQAGKDRDQQRDLEREVPRVGVDAQDLGLDGFGSPASCFLSCVLLMNWASCSSALATVLLIGRRQHGACVCHVGEGERERREQDRPAERQAERQPERAGRRVDAGSLADALLRDR